MASSLLNLNGITKSGFNVPENCPGTIVGLSQYGQEVAAVVSSQISSAPQEGAVVSFHHVSVRTPVVV